MKRLILSLSIISTIVCAQEPRPMELMLNSGFNFTQYKSGSIKGDFVFGYDIGVGMTHFFNQTSGINVGLEFSQINSSAKNVTVPGIPVTASKVDISAKYLSIPILYTYSTTPKKGFVFSIGPSVFMPIGDTNLDVSTSAASFSQKLSAKFAIGSQIQTGFRWEVDQKSSMGIDLVIKHSLSDLVSTSTDKDKQSFFNFGLRVVGVY